MKTNYLEILQGMYELLYSDNTQQTREHQISFKMKQISLGVRSIIEDDLCFLCPYCCVKKHTNELLIKSGWVGGCGVQALRQHWKKSSGVIAKTDRTLNPSPAPRSINITPSTNPNTSASAGEYQQPRLETPINCALHVEWARVRSLSVSVRW